VLAGNKIYAVYLVPCLCKLTLFILLCNSDGSIVLRKDVLWHRVYEFIFDRLRAVRQDMVIQRIGGNSAICILESSVRFLIYAGYRLENNSTYLSIYNVWLETSVSSEALLNIQLICDL